MAIKQHLLHKELSYQIQGAAIEVRKNFGSGHKESLYQNAFAEELDSRRINFEREKSIRICSPKTGKVVGYYRPDFIVDSKIIVELKAVEKIPRMFIDQLYDYLRNSEYELGYFINFASPKLYSERIIFTNDRKPKLKQLLVVLSFLFVAVSVLPIKAQAAELYFGVHGREVGLGERFEVGVFMNTEGESVNAAGGTIEFPSHVLALDGVKDGGSVVSFWVERPGGDGRLAFSGIVPGGYVGGGGYLFSAFFRARSAGEVVITSAGEQFLLSDGRGSEAPARRAPLALRVLGSARGLEVAQAPDTDPPEPFTPSLAQDAAVFDGKWFLAFATQDKGSGMDHYEVKEPRYGIGRWRAVASPFLLRNQALDVPVYVKAVDAAGNERIAMLPPQRPRPWYEDVVVWGILILTGAVFTIRARKLWDKRFRGT